MRGLLLAAALGASTTACLRTTEFHCTTSADCSATGAVCESNGYCSFIDKDCAGGRRYGDLSGPVAGQCVGQSTMPDAGVDAMVDAPAPGNCKSTYAALGSSAHRYRVISAPATWNTQRGICNADGSTSYLAVPNDQTELTALAAAPSAARFWVGIDDQAAEGTYAMQRGGTLSATDMMWDLVAVPPEPNNTPSSGGGQADCVNGQMSNSKLADDNCTKTFPAICECEP